MLLTSFAFLFQNNFVRLVYRTNISYTLVQGQYYVDDLLVSILCKEYIIEKR